MRERAVEWCNDRNEVKGVLNGGNETQSRERLGRKIVKQNT